MIRKICTYLFLFLFSTGCEKTYDFLNNSENMKIPVIEAIITGLPEYQIVRLSYSVAFDDSASSTPVENANVRIATENGDTIQFGHTENGYYTCNNLLIEPEKYYSLLVKIAGITYTASSIVQPVHGLDSVTYSFYKKNEGEDPAYFLKLFAGNNNTEQARYLQLHLYKNNQLLTNGIDVILISDLATPMFNGIELDNPFAKNDTVDIELYSLTEDMFSYYLYIYDNILLNVNYNLEFKTNPPAQYTPKALGYFQLSEVVKKRIIIQ